LASFLWIGAIVYTVYLVLVQDIGRKIESYLPRYLLICWGIPLLSVVWIAIFGRFGDAGWACWIPRSYPWLRFFWYYFPLGLVFVYTAYMNCCGGLSSAVLNVSHRARLNSRLRLYSAVFLVIRLPSVINRVLDLFLAEPTFVFSLLHAMFSPLQGFANACVFGFISLRCCKRLSDQASNGNLEMAEHEAQGGGAPFDDGGARIGQEEDDDLEPISLDRI